MRFKMNVSKHTIAIFLIVGISGLLYTSSFLPSAFAQNTPNTDTGSQQQGSQQPGAGTFEELQNLTQGNKDLLANNTPISNSSLSSGLQLEQDTDKSKAGQETDEQKLGHNPQGQSGPALNPTTSQMTQTGQQQQSGQSGQNQTGQGQATIRTIRAKSNWPRSTIRTIRAKSNWSRSTIRTIRAKSKYGTSGSNRSNFRWSIWG